MASRQPCLAVPRKLRFGDRHRHHAPAPSPSSIPAAGTPRSCPSPRRGSPAAPPTSAGSSPPSPRGHPASNTGPRPRVHLLPDSPVGATISVGMVLRPCGFSSFGTRIVVVAGARDAHGTIPGCRWNRTRPAPAGSTTKRCRTPTPTTAITSITSLRHYDGAGKRTPGRLSPGRRAITCTPTP